MVLLPNLSLNRLFTEVRTGREAALDIVVPGVAFDSNAGARASPAGSVFSYTDAETCFTGFSNRP
jgi:hypothetical protein